MKGQNKISPTDYRFVPVDPEPGFDADHNKRVIEGTIKKHEANIRRKKRKFHNQVSERSSAIATYLKGLQMGKTTSNVEKYFGRKELAKLRGKQIIEELRHGQEQKRSEKKSL